MKRHPKAKMNIPMCAACVLFCLTLFSAYLTGGLFARYTTSGTGGDSARVAKFDVTHDGAYFKETLHIESRPGESDVLRKDIKVVNKSEVAVEYIVTIKNTTGNIPYYFSVNGSTMKKTQCTYSERIEPATEETVTITAKWDVEGATAYIGMVDVVTVEVVAQQLD